MNGGRSRPGGWRFTDGMREFRLFPEQRRFFNGDDEIALTVRAFDLLVLLVRHAGQIVGKKQILAEVWRNYEVSDSSISNHVSAVRRAMGRDVVTTINGQGYQFILPVEGIDVPVLPARPIELMPGLPHPSANGVGREEELGQLAELLAQHRIVTIIGPGGIGKTWLAVAQGWRLAAEFPDGVYLADLSAARDAMALASTIAQRLNIALRSSDNPVRIIGGSIDKRKALLILDSCEYVIDAARTMVAGLLELAPNLSVLATSQAALQLPKEKIFRLRPLPIDDAVALFVGSARTAGDAFEPTEQNAATVLEICRRLDGVPLALEMAAASVPVHGIKKVLAGLDERFDMLDSAPRRGAERQATLSAVMDWSYGLLDDADKEVFCRLACFAGSFTADAAAAVAWQGNAGKWRVPVGLSRMADKSLLVQQDGEPPRYRMLETIGLYAAAKLEESGDRDAVAERHARYYAELFETADEAWETMPDAEWTALYRPEIDNARAALDWALATPERRNLAIALGGAVAHLWERIDLSVEGRAYMDRIVDLIDENVPIPDTARLLKSAGMLWRRTDRPRAIALTEQSIAVHRQFESGPKTGTALGFLGGDYVFLGRHAEARALLEEAHALLSAGGHAKSLFRVTNGLGALAEFEGRAADAFEYFTVARDLALSLNDGLRANIVIINLGVLEFVTGNIERAIEHFREAASGLKPLGPPVYFAYAVVNLAACLGLQGEHAEARGHAADALTRLRSDGGPWLKICLQLWAFLGSRAGRHAEAAQLLGFIDAGFARSGEIRPPISQRVYEAVSNLLASHCTPDNLRAWAEDGARWSEAQAADFVARRLVAAAL
jgi:predicted ATPase